MTGSVRDIRRLRLARLLAAALLASSMGGCQLLWPGPAEPPPSPPPPPNSNELPTCPGDPRCD